MFGDWISGTGEPFRDFGPSSPEAGDMKDAPGVNRARAYFHNKNKNAKCCSDLVRVTDFGAKFGLKGLWEAKLNPTRQFLGSYSVNIIPVRTTGQQCQVRVLIFNTTSATSFFYGHGPSWERGWLLFTRPMGNMRETITWTEPYNP